VVSLLFPDSYPRNQIYASSTLDIFFWLYSGKPLTEKADNVKNPRQSCKNSSSVMSVGPVLQAPQHVAAGPAAGLAPVKAVEEVDAALEQTSGFLGVPGAPSGHADLIASLGGDEGGRGDKSKSGELHVGLFWLLWTGWSDKVEIKALSLGKARYM
jgi:hypothetical protein